MSRFSVEAVFKAVDRMTAPVTRMQNSVGKLTRSMGANLNSLNRTVDGVTSKIGGMAKSVAVGAGVIIAATGGAIAYLAREFSKIEDAEAAFTPLIGGAAKAKQLVDELNKAAAATPFQFNDIASVAKQLLPVMNGDIQRTVDTMKMLGDTAGGNAQKLDSITRGFTKAMLKGKVDMESLNMIGEAGVPIFTELANSMGVKVNKSFFKMISAGKVTTQQLTAAFQKMTGEGGIFFQGMEISSRTMSGMWSTLSDNISLAAADIGRELAPAIKDLIVWATKVTQNIRDWVIANKELIKLKIAQFIETAKNAISRLVDEFSKMNKEYSLMDRAIDILIGVGKAIGFLVTHGATIAKVTVIVIGLLLALKTLVLVMTAVNLVMALSPIGLVVMGVIALIAAIAAVIYWFDEIVAVLASVWEAFMNLSNGVIIAMALMTGPIGWFIGAAMLIAKHWEPISEFFTGLWSGIVSTFESGIAFIMSIVDRVRGAISGVVDSVSSVAGYFGIGGEEEQSKAGATGPQVVSPQERTARSIEETRTTSTAEVTLKAPAGTAQVTKGKIGGGLKLQSSGAF